MFIQVSDNLSPIVSPTNNFDVLNIPKDHQSRKLSDTFYINEDLLLRTHTSAHQKEHLERKLQDFVVFGNNYSN